MGNPQPETSFYKNRPMGDGLSNECIDCKKARQKKWNNRRTEDKNNFFKLLLG